MDKTYQYNTPSSRVYWSAWAEPKMRVKMTLTDSIARFLSISENPVLFAGAGVSVRAGIPSWHDYIKCITADVGTFDDLISQIMQRSIDETNLTNAAEYYFACRTIPAGEKLKILTRPLQTYDSILLSGLVDLPFASIVTTNFDRSILDAFAATKGCAPIEINLHDPIMRKAPFNNEQYIARIHGRVEVPETMVLSDSQFERLRANESYNSFLTHIFTRRQILFIGFSFLDPAILSVLNTIRDTVGSCHYGSHLALLPDDSKNLKTRLAELNIEAYTYDAKNHHMELWSAISALGGRSWELEGATRETRDPFDRAKRYLATVYARHTLGAGRRPLRMAIFEGIIAEILRTHCDDCMNVEEVTLAFRSEVHLPAEVAKRIVTNALVRLTEDGYCSKIMSESTRYKWTGPDGSNFDDAIEKIVNGVVDRYVVREGGGDTGDIRCCVDALIRKSLLVRGWDLGAAFAAGQPPEGMDLKPIFDRIDDCSSLKGLAEESRIIAATIDVFQHPDTEQARILCELGRISFGVELALEAPHDTIMYTLTLPERIYLDTNILLPIIVPNHRFHDIYSATIDKLLEAAAEAFVQVEVVVSREFLGEVIGHRKIALEEITLMGPKVREQIELDAAYRGAENINVYLSGYINISPDSDDANITFDDFLRKHAPYSTIQQLENWLSDRNILVIDKRKLIGDDGSHSKILHSMEKAFADAVASRHRTATLIAHDAVQLAALHNDYNRGRRSIFVTADRQVREFVAASRFARLGNSMISHVGLVQLVDLLIGNIPETRALTALMWSASLTTRGEKLRTYFVNRALAQYDEALAMEIPKLVDEITEKVMQRGEASGLEWENDSPKERAKVRRFLEEFEDDYFQGMRESIERRRNQIEK